MLSIAFIVADEDRPKTDKLSYIDLRRVREEPPSWLFAPAEYDGAIVGLVRRRNDTEHVAYDLDRMIEIAVALSGQDPESEDTWANAHALVHRAAKHSGYLETCSPVVLRELNAMLPLPADEDIVACAGKNWTLV